MNIEQQNDIMSDCDFDNLNCEFANKLSIQKIVDDDINELNFLMECFLEMKKDLNYNKIRNFEMEFTLMKFLPTNNITIGWIIQYVDINNEIINKTIVKLKNLSEKYINKIKEYNEILKEHEQWDDKKRLENTNTINYANKIFEENSKKILNDLNWINEKIDRLNIKLEEEKKINISQDETFVQMLKIMYEINDSLGENTDSSNIDAENEIDEIFNTMDESLKKEFSDYGNIVINNLNLSLNTSEDELKEWNLKNSIRNKDYNKFIFEEFSGFTKEKLETIMNYYNKDDTNFYDSIKKFGHKIINILETINENR